MTKKVFLRRKRGIESGESGPGTAVIRGDRGRDYRSMSEAAETEGSACADSGAGYADQPRRSTNAQLLAAKQWVVSFGEMKDGRSAAAPPPVDTGVFWRCPCLIDGAKIGGIGSYPKGPRGGMLGNILRTSDRNYLMRSFCTDGASTSGAKFASFKQTNVYQRTAAWQTPSNLEDHHGDETVVDACHAGLFSMNYAERRTDILTRTESILEAIKPGATQCLFINCFSQSGPGFQCAGFEDTAVSRAIAATRGSLRCLSLTESQVCKSDVEALMAGGGDGGEGKEGGGDGGEGKEGQKGKDGGGDGGGCTDLRGFMLSQCSNSTTDPLTDEAMAAMLRSPTGRKLRWLWVDIR